MTDLLTCWSCGGKATLIEDEPTQGFCFVECVDCGARGPITAKEQAIAAWNTRVNVERGIPMTEENMAKHGWVRERTCKPVDIDGVMRCPECDYPLGIMSVPAFCAGCGAKVVE